MNRCIGFDSDFFVCSKAHSGPLAELDLLEVHTWSVQTCAQLWDPEKVLQTVVRNHTKKSSEGNATLPLPAGIWRKARSIEEKSNDLTVTHRLYHILVYSALMVPHHYLRGEKIKKRKSCYKMSVLWSTDKMQTHQNIFSFSIPFLRWNIMVGFKVGTMLPKGSETQQQQIHLSSWSTACSMRQH